MTTELKQIQNQRHMTRGFVEQNVMKAKARDGPDGQAATMMSVRRKMGTGL
jgi:hypothetical protein